MTRKPRYFIYDRKEVVVLVMLGLSVAVFSFTLGVHLGKQVGPKGMAPELADAAPAETVEEATPDRVGLVEQGEGVEDAVTESLDKAIHEEVSNTGIKLNKRRQVDLPAGTASRNGGATTTSKAEPKVEVKVEPPQLAPAAETAGAETPDTEAAEVHTPPTPEGVTEVVYDPVLKKPAPQGKFTIQVGSFPSIAEAKVELKSLESKGVAPFLRQMDVKGKGQWYRIYLGGYASKKQAELEGSSLRQKDLIQDFIVSRMP